MLRSAAVPLLLAPGLYTIPPSGERNVCPRAVLFERDLSRIARILGTGLAAFLALRVTDGLLTGLGATLLFLFVLTLPWEMANRLSDRLNDS